MQYETYKMGKTSDTSGSIERRRFGDVAGEAIESATADWIYSFVSDVINK